MNENPIGIFDSGIGGLTIMKEMIKELPFENIIYFADTARHPYGNKSGELILRYVLESAAYLIDQKIKILILACFTASSFALETLEQKLAIPVVGMIQSGCEALKQSAGSKRIAILGTSSTVQSGVIQSLIETWNPKPVIFPVACPLLAPMIEEGLSSHPATKLMVHHYLSHLKKQSLDAALLACTHYPLIYDLIQNALGERVHLIQPARLCALRTKELLKSNRLLNSGWKNPYHKFHATENVEKFIKTANEFLHPIDFSVEKTKNI